MKGAVRVTAMSPEGAIQVYEGDAIRVDICAGGDHWTLHVDAHQGQTGLLVGVIPKTWAIKLLLP